MIDSGYNITDNATATVLEIWGFLRLMEPGFRRENLIT
jgi:hypothetical protein